MNEIRPFDDRKLAIQTTVFFPGSNHLEPALKYSDLIGACQRSLAFVSVIIFQIELKAGNSGYF